MSMRVFVFALVCIIPTTLGHRITLHKRNCNNALIGNGYNMGNGYAPNGCANYNAIPANSINLNGISNCNNGNNANTINANAIGFVPNPNGLNAGRIVNAAPQNNNIGFGDVAIVGELPVSGSTVINGNVPVIGYVTFEGDVPAGGLVSVLNGACNCNQLNLPY